MNDGKWLRKTIEELVPEWETESIESIANELTTSIFEADRNTVLYQNWNRLMEMEARWASEADPNYSIPVTPLPSEFTDLLPLFLSRENISEFLQEHFIECESCNKRFFLGFHISPTIPFEDTDEERISEWRNGEKKVSVQQTCPECESDNSAVVPPAIPPEAWHQWWFKIGKILQTPLAEKLHDSRRFKVSNIEKDIKLETNNQDSDFHIPVIVTEADGNKIAIDVVRSPFLPPDLIQETYHKFHTLCERNDISEKIIIILGSFPKSSNEELLSLKKEHLDRKFNDESKYRNIHLHTISYPEELDFVLNQMFYEYRIKGNPESPIYDRNNWERKLMDLGEEGSQQERQITRDKLLATRGPIFEQAIKRYLESEGYSTKSSDELDELKVDIVAKKQKEDSEVFRLIQCKAGNIESKEIEEINEGFKEVENRIRGYRELFIDNLSFEYEIFIGKDKDRIKPSLKEAGFKVKTTEDIPKDELDPRQRDVLHLIKTTP